MAMRLTPGGVEVLIPALLDEESEEVKGFIQEGLKRLSGEPLPAICSSPWDRGYILKVVKRWAEKLGVEVKRVYLRQMNKKWASCSGKGVLTLNRDITLLPQELLDYLICHELIHIKIPNHGKNFKTLMASYIPNWRERHKNLMLYTLKNKELKLKM